MKDRTLTAEFGLFHLGIPLSTLTLPDGMKIRNKDVGLFVLLALAFLSACGNSGTASSSLDREEEQRLLPDSIGECYTRSDARETGPALYVNGYALDAEQARNVRWIKRCVLPFFPGTPEQKATIASHTAWWSLREGILELGAENSIRYSNCHENGRDRGRTGQPLYNCPTNIWQVGLAAAQVANYSDALVKETVDEVFGGLDSRIDERALLGWSASLAGFHVGSPVRTGILNSKGRVRRSWLLRNPVIGFMLVEKQEVVHECLVQRKRWCYGSAYPSAKKFARNDAALRQSMADLKRIFTAR